VTLIDLDLGFTDHESIGAHKPKPTEQDEKTRGTIYRVKALKPEVESVPLHVTEGIAHGKIDTKIHPLPELRYAEPNGDQVCEVPEAEIEPVD
jgi:hypothetical protein